MSALTEMSIFVQLSAKLHVRFLLLFCIGSIFLIFQSRSRVEDTSTCSMLRMKRGNFNYLFTHEPYKVISDWNVTAEACIYIQIFSGPNFSYYWP